MLPSRPRLVALLVFAAAVTAVHGTSAQVERTERPALRVCADPDAMPFSNRDGKGFENRIAAMMAAELRLPLETVWYPQTVGFVRNTLGARQCDLVLGTAAGETLMQNTNPYYRSAYALVVRADSGLDVDGMLMGKLRHRRVAVVERTPGAELATALGVSDVVSYSLLTPGVDGPVTASAVAAVRSRAVDAALIWAPAAGYFAQTPGAALFVLPIPDGTVAQRTEFNIAMGLRSGEPGWKAWLNGWIRANHERVTQLLTEYAVPIVE